MHLSMSSRRGGERGIGRDLYIFQRLLSNSLPKGKNVRSNITKFPNLRNDLWSRARTKIQIPLVLNIFAVFYKDIQSRTKSLPDTHLAEVSLTNIHDRFWSVLVIFGINASEKRMRLSRRIL